MPDTLPRPILAVLPLALAGYVAALFMPAFACETHAGWRGLEVLRIGFFGFLVLDPRWFANLGAYWLAFALFRGRPVRHLVPVAGATLVLALASLLIPAMACGQAGGALAASQGLAAGGYLWVLAVSLVALCALAMARRWPAPAPVLPAASPSAAAPASAKRTVLIAGALIAGAGPLAFGLLGGLSQLLPNCTIGVSESIGSCELGGASLRDLIKLAMPALMLSFFTVPAGLLLLLLGALWPSAKAAPAGLSPASHLDPTRAALASYRAGQPVCARCPRCHSVLLVAPDKTRNVPGAACVSVSCACGACDGAYSFAPQ